MTLTKKVRWMGVAAASAVVLGVTSALPAEAAQDFSLDTASTNINDGSVHARGAITFTGAYSFSVSSTVWDSCPGDGDGAYLTYNVDVMDGTGWGYPANDAFNRDTNGCDNGKISNTITRTFSKRVKRVQFVVREADNGFTKESDTSTWKANPNT